MARYATRSTTTGTRVNAVPRPCLRSNPSFQNDDILGKNRLLLLHLEQLGILAPGVLTIDVTGELVADLSAGGREEEPDDGTMTGLFPNQSTTDIDEQIPSWLRDYLARELDVYGYGPPAACAALYDQLKRSQADVGINTSVRTAETLLRCASMALKHSIEDIQEFVDAEVMVEDTYELEVGMIVRTVKRLVSAGDDRRGKRLPKDIQLLLDIGSMGVTMKSAMETSLQSLVVEPYKRLVEKLDMVARGLQRECEREAEQGKSEDGFSSDSGVDGC